MLEKICCGHGPCEKLHAAGRSLLLRKICCGHGGRATQREGLLLEKCLTALVKHLSAGFMFAAERLFATAVPFETRYCFADGKHLLLNNVCFSIFAAEECLLRGWLAAARIFVSAARHIFGAGNNVCCSDVIFARGIAGWCSLREICAVGKESLRERWLRQ